MKALNDGKVNESDEKTIKTHLSLLENTIIASVALDASSVFEKQENSSTQNLVPTKQDNYNVEFGNNASTSFESSSIKNIQKRRKCIKSKAIEAMAENGVDIGSYVPNTIDEVLSLLRSGSKEAKNNDQDSISNSLKTKSTTSSLSSSAIKGAGTTVQYESSYEQNSSKPVDKLIVLCSCGDELKFKIARQSKSVEEWSIDPPTTAAKNGEGDAAYLRVSLELKNEVDILMKSLISDASFD